MSLRWGVRLKFNMTRFVLKKCVNECTRKTIEYNTNTFCKNFILSETLPCPNLNQYVYIIIICESLSLCACVSIRTVPWIISPAQVRRFVWPEGRAWKDSTTVECSLTYTKFTCRLQELERSINSLFRHLFACKILWRPVICKLRRQKRYQSCSFFFLISQQNASAEFSSSHGCLGPRRWCGTWNLPAGAIPCGSSARQ